MYRKKLNMVWHPIGSTSLLLLYDLYDGNLWIQTASNTLYVALGGTVRHVYVV